MGNGSHIAAVQSLLKSQFPSIGGLKDPITQLSTKSDISLSSGSLQILHINSNHWITVSTCNLKDVDNIVNDSKYQHLEKATKRPLAKLVCTKQDSLKVSIANINKQSGSDDCGVFSAAYCTSLAYQQDPGGVVYDQSKMREH